MDINFLKSMNLFSFGARKEKPVSAIDTGIVHIICNLPVHIYYYTSKNKMIYTPAGIHTTYSNSYEGPHHPMCKIDQSKYNDYTFNEGGMKWKGSNIIFSTEYTENNKPLDYNDDMVLAVIIACFYSLIQRLHFYVHIVADLDKTIDEGHNRAYVYTNQILL
jgi:hypothetical protein